jgi:putative photosynthetic complex assembly protein
MTTLSQSPVSRTGLIAAISLVFIALALTTASRVSQIVRPAAIDVPTAVPASSIELVFLDEPDGSVQVRRSDDRSLVQVIKPTTGGFVRGVMRGFARDRMVRGVGSTPPFQLALSQSGELSLTDMATGRVTVLEAFGSTNRAAFASMLPAQHGLPAQGGQS